MRAAGSQGRRRAVALDWGPLMVLGVFSIVAVIGYAVFGRDPSRLGGLPPAAASFYAVSFSFFAQTQIVLAGLVLALHLWRRSSFRWVPAFVAVYAISLGSELLGTAHGVPFGPYRYTDLLGWKWLDLVPALIPLSWFFMAVPAYALAARVTGGAEWSGGASSRSHAVRRVVLGSLLLLAWDLTLDPAMSEVTRYWVWGEVGPYYGMPLMNLVGWYVTGVVLMAALEWLGARRWLSDVSTGWHAAFYAANVVLPLGMTIVAGFWGAVVATVVVLGAVAVWVWLSPGSRGHADARPERLAREAEAA